MLGIAGIPLGLTFRFLDPSPDAPAADVGELIVGKLDDTAALEAVARDAVAVTYEWEGVPAASARHLAQTLIVRPGDRSLEVAQDRLAEKETFRRLGIATPSFCAAGSRDDLERAVATVGGLPAMVKTRRGGYDGKGQQRLCTAVDVDVAWSTLGHEPLIVEALVPFRRELSVVAVRGADGAVAVWPLAHNEHREGILRTTIAPAPDVEPSLRDEAEKLVDRLLNDLGHVGVLTVELFEHEGRLLANEIAPRVHNSGHWTIEGAETSQFENHLRAVLGLPLGSVEPRGISAMINLIGVMPSPDARRDLLAVPGVHLHDYAKAPRPGRKLGHVTVTAGSSRELDGALARVHQILDRA